MFRATRYSDRVTSFFGAWAAACSRGLKLRRGFSLAEALIAIAIAAIAAGALLLGTHASVQNAEEAWKRTVAAGMAQQLMDEIVGNKYCAYPDNPYETQLGRSWWEAAGKGRERYNDIDDYNGLRIQPPTDLWGVRLGVDDGLGGVRHPAFQAPTGLLDRWRQEVDVYYVNEANPSQRLASGQVSNARAVEVRIMENAPQRGWRQLARLRRIVAYVPPPP